MKLIVLYGPENSGKTTTLKMVYEYLKQFNQVETHWFKYYDSDRAHNDFRDVLVLDQKDVRSFGSNVGVAPKSTYKKGVDTPLAQEDFDNDDYEPIVDFPFSGKDIEDSFPVDDIPYDSLPLKEPSDLAKLETHIPTLATIQPLKVGLILEGDYGTNTKKIGRDLYSHLKELEFCDIIICACSQNKKKGLPIHCLMKFIKETPTKYFVVWTKSNTLVNERRASRLILYYLSII